MAFYVVSQVLRIIANVDEIEELHQRRLPGAGYGLPQLGLIGAVNPVSGHRNAVDNVYRDKGVVQQRPSDQFVERFRFAGFDQGCRLKVGNDRGDIKLPMQSVISMTWRSYQYTAESGSSS